ncbi:MAG: hypothetical protein Q9228_006164 [Teloschistes exilis]
MLDATGALPGRDCSLHTVFVYTILWEVTHLHTAVVTLVAAGKLCINAIPSLVEARGNELVATITIMLIIATLAVILRLYARRISAAKLGPDDYWILIALILTYGLDVNSFFCEWHKGK